MNNISVIIPSLSNKITSELIDEIKQFKPIEIIIINNGPPVNNTDNLIKYYNIPHKNNAATNRNLGASKAIGDYLLFIDDDVLVDSQYIFDYFVIKKIKYDLVYGLYSKLNIEDSVLDYFPNQILIQRSLECQIFSSSFFLIKKNVYKDLNGFNEELDTYEDIEFYNRCIQEKINTHFDSKFLGTHLKKYTLINLIKDYFVKVSNSIFAKRKYKLIFKIKTIDFLTKIFFLFFPIFITILSFLYSFNLFNIKNLVLFSFLYLFINYFISLKLFKTSNIYYFIKIFFLLIIISSTIIYATLISYIYIFSSSISRFFITAFDYFRMLKRIILRNGYPIQIIHYVTARCNLRCSHCFYKETLDKKDPGEQSLEIFKKTSKQIGPVLWYALAGGEVFIRSDFVKLLTIIINVCRPKYISIPTNGWYTERTITFIIQILRKYPDLFFSLYFSIDGHEDIHDQIRGENSFKKLKVTYFKLKKLQKYYKNFNLNIVTTITEHNCKDSEKFIEDINKEFKPNAISINLFRYHSLKHPKIPDNLIESYNKAYERYFSLVDQKKISGLKSIFSNVFTFKDKIQKFIINKVAKYNEFVTPCTAGNLSYVIMEDGTIKPCEILDNSIGNVVSDNNISEIFKSNKAKKLRKWITDTECKCTYECAMSTNAFFSWPMTKKYFRFFIGQNKI